MISIERKIIKATRVEQSSKRNHSNFGRHKKEGEKSV